jgi:hypothetical protein
MYASRKMTAALDDLDAAVRAKDGPTIRRAATNLVECHRVATAVACVKAGISVGELEIAGDSGTGGTVTDRVRVDRRVSKGSFDPRSALTAQCREPNCVATISPRFDRFARATGLCTTHRTRRDGSPRQALVEARGT